MFIQDEPFQSWKRENKCLASPASVLTFGKISPEPFPRVSFACLKCTKTFQVIEDRNHIAIDTHQLRLV